jgi:hypothetical protein
MVTMDAALGDLPDGEVHVRDWRIVAVGRRPGTRWRRAPRTSTPSSSTAASSGAAAGSRRSTRSASPA